MRQFSSTFHISWMVSSVNLSTLTTMANLIETLSEACDKGH